MIDLWLSCLKGLVFSISEESFLSLVEFVRVGAVALRYMVRGRGQPSDPRKVLVLLELQLVPILRDSSTTVILQYATHET